MPDFVIRTTYGLQGFTPTERRVIDTPAFQRLRGVRQLSFVYQVYPQAGYSRFEHSLGVNGMAKRVGRQIGLEKHERKLYALAGLCHDLGHGPYSHASEPPLARANEQLGGSGGLTHETISREVLTDPRHEVKNILERGGANPEEVADMIFTEGKTTILRGVLDPDKMDYLRRDASAVGTGVGTDIDGLVMNLSLGRIGGVNKLVLDEKGLAHLKSFLTAEVLLYNSVYFHHAARSAGLMHEAGLWYLISKARERSESDDDFKKELKTIWRYKDQQVDSAMQAAGGLAAEMSLAIEDRKLYKRLVELSKRKVDEIDNGLFSKLEKIRRDNLFYKRKRVPEFTSAGEYLQGIISEGLSDELGVEVQPHEVLVEVTPPLERGLREADPKDVTLFIRDGDSIRPVTQFPDVCAVISQSESDVRRLNVFWPERHRKLTRKKGTEERAAKIAMETIREFAKAY